MASLIQRPSKSGPVYYVQYWQGTKQKRFRASESFQIAKQMLRDFENAQARGEASAMPSKTPVAEVLGAYIEAHPLGQDPQVRPDRHLPPAGCFWAGLPGPGNYESQGFRQDQETPTQAGTGPSVQGPRR
jgi:hypothetical protein